MFLKNCWYCAGWDHEVSQSKNAIVSRKIAGEDIVLYRKANGAVVALEDRCPHRQAPLSMGQKESDGSLRCMYHGMKFNPENGNCTEIPGMDVIPQNACVKVFPVVEKNNWIWVWMGDSDKADPNLICDSIGPGNEGYNIKTSKMHVNANYRLEIANLMDLSHLTWVHKSTFGGTDAYAKVKSVNKIVNGRGLETEFWLRSVPAPLFAQHIFPEGMLFDLHFHRVMTVPCNFILHFSVHIAGKNIEGPSDGALVLDTWTSQSVTPRDEDSVDYYFSWGTSKATDGPGVTDMLYEAVHEAFLEDKAMIEAQHKRIKAKPDAPKVDIIHDAGPGKMLWLLDKLLREEREQFNKSSD